MTQPSRFLLDTNVVSETRKPRPSHLVTEFLALHEEADIFLSVMSLAELRFGAANPRVVKSAQTEKIIEWIDQIQTQDFAGRILGINEDVAALWGNLSAQRSRPIIDTFIAATAIVHDLTLVTRNVADFQDVPLKLLNPWKA